MDLSKVGYGFLIILALTLNFGFFLGEYDHSGLNHFSLLLAAAFANIICVYFIFQRNTTYNERVAVKGREILFATGFVASVQLCLAIAVWILSVSFELIEPSNSRILSFSGGALLANLITTCIVVIDTLQHRQDPIM